MIELIPYNKKLEDEWNGFISLSKNGTFLIDRKFMDYHSDRFTDCSIIFKEKGRIISCLPANFCEQTKTVYSHQGLTYGSFITSEKVTTKKMLLFFEEALAYYKEKLDAKRLIYKPIPQIYSSYPTEEDLYALFRYGAKLESRGISSTIDLHNPIPMLASRKYMINKAQKRGLSTVIATSEDCDKYDEYWNLLATTLQQRHDTSPVHTANEMKLLARRFPENIQLRYTVNNKNEMIAGSWIFITSQVIHTQYLAANAEGRESGALDLLINNHIESHKGKIHYLDFGISTESGGKKLNEGLIFQKEGFGGRGICYDTYSLEL